MAVHHCPLELLEIEPAGVHCLVKADVAGLQMNLVLDTGASRTVFHEDLLRELLGDESLRLSEEPSAAIGVSTLRSHLATLPLLELGTLRIEHFEVVAIDLSNIIDSYEFMNLPPISGILGGDVLKKYRAVIDYGRKEMRLKCRKKANS